MAHSPAERPHAQGFLVTELLNGVTHGVGFALSTVGLVLLVSLAASRGGARHIVACSVYGATLMVLYLASTLYHSVRSPRLKHALRVVDHVAIYLLIAGTYTPFALITLHGERGWALFFGIWGLAAFGIVLKTLCFGRYPRLTFALYVVMGWAATIMIDPLLESMSLAGVAWLVAGGLAYTSGIVFYVWTSIPHHHAIWHVFVMLGSSCHFFAVMFYVLPPAA